MGRGKHGGWRLELDGRTGIYLVRFTHKGKRRHLSTGERDFGAAQREGAAIYARTVSGRKQGTPVKAPDLRTLMAMWIDHYEADHAPETAREYERYSFSLFVPTFGSLANMTTESCDDYAMMRLRSVKAVTVRKELSALRTFLTWCHERGYLPEEVRVKGIKKRTLGTPSTKSPQVHVTLTMEDLDRMITKIPERTKRPRGRPDEPAWPVRAAVLVLMETGVRIATLRRLRAPEHYHRGAEVLTITEDVDKARAGRPLPLSTHCREALDSVCPDVGAIFGPINLRYQLASASTDIGLPAHEDGRVSHHDLRRTFLTHLAESGASIAAIQYLGGHKHASTSARYIRPGQRAAEEGMKLLEANRPRNRPQPVSAKKERKGSK